MQTQSIIFLVLTAVFYISAIQRRIYNPTGHKLFMMLIYLAIISAIGAIVTVIIDKKEKLSTRDWLDISIILIASLLSVILGINELSPVTLLLTSTILLIATFSVLTPV